MDNLYDLTLDKLGNLSLENRVEGYSNFDILTGVGISQRFVPLNGTRRLPSYSLYPDVLEDGVGHH